MAGKVFVVDHDEFRRRAIVCAVQQASWEGWGADAMDGAGAADLLLLADAPGAFDAIAALRADPATRALPILGYGGAAPPEAADLDGWIADPRDGAALAATLALWAPDPPPAARAGLAALFGAAEVARLYAGLRDQLAEGLALIAAPDAAPRAHRIAGLAGTLGYGAVYEAWYRLSEGEAAARPEARRLARKALHALDRAAAAAG
ncbi:hypothetical protein [Sphingomonas morindae]|uniref:Uncharacterized protein n=1 Tax=Sphingomonas morindae TaxID=1541170 RepID=A0ABY4X481_9SPHN|nr:hypothetical protein [Sphingomonas morindae]USI71698.1 hypothetical protein LHA26_10200 [Sphingomonas morindae]